MSPRSQALVPPFSIATPALNRPFILNGEPKTITPLTTGEPYFMLLAQRISFVCACSKHHW